MHIYLAAVGIINDDDDDDDANINDTFMLTSTSKTSQRFSVSRPFRVLEAPRDYATELKSIYK